MLKAQPTLSVLYLDPDAINGRIGTTELGQLKHAILF